MSEASESVDGVVGTPDPPPQSVDAGHAAFRLDMLLIGVVIVGAIITSNIWLRRRAEHENQP